MPKKIAYGFLPIADCEKEEFHGRSDSGKAVASHRGVAPTPALHSN